MRAELVWVKDNIETFTALTLASVVSVLGLADAVSPDLIEKTIPLTLAVFAFALLRERWRRDEAEKQIARSVQSTERILGELGQRIDGIATVETAITRVTKVLSDLSAVRVLTGDDISTALYEARQNTSIWIFKGGTGTFTRLVTLPDCITNARRHRRELRMYLEILDPTDPLLCERYVKLYKSLAEESTDNEMSWDADGTRRELYATVLAACWYRKQYQMLDIQIEVGLSQIISTLRWDLSSHSLIITQRGPRFPALIIERNKIHYASWHTELWTSFGQCRRVPLELADGVIMSDSPTTSEVRDMFDAIKLSLPIEYDEKSVSEIIGKAFHDNDPYTRGAGERVPAAQLV
jgi:hypothetical protein